MRRNLVAIACLLGLASCEPSTDASPPGIADRPNSSSTASATPATASPATAPGPKRPKPADSDVFAFVQRPVCAQRYPNYRKIPVEIAAGETRVLTAAVDRVIEHWFRNKPRFGSSVARGIEVGIEGDRAVMDVRDRKHLGWGSTSCGSTIFIGDLVHTALQFPTVSAVEFRYRGSCTDWGKYVQAGPFCFIYSLDGRGRTSSIRRKDA
jgi:hypothetical protein